MSYTPLYLGPNVTIDNTGKLSFNNTQLNDLADPTLPQQTATKNYVDQTILSLSSATVSNISNSLTQSQNNLNTSVTRLQGQIDTILTGSGDLDTLKEIVDYAKALDLTESTNLQNAVTSINSNLNAEITRATNSEKIIQSNIRKSIKLIPTPTVYADGEPPIPQPPCVLSNGYDGWYFKNTYGKKQNLYIPVPANTTVKDIKGMYANAKVLNNASNLFMVLYTKMKQSGNAGSWYGAKQAYDVGSTPPSIGNTLFGAMNNSSFDVVNNGLTTPYQLLLSSVASLTLGTVLPDDEVQYITIHTSSVAAVGTVEFILNSFSISLPDGVHEYTFSNCEVQQIADENAHNVEISARTAADNTLQTNISLEAARAVGSENTIATNLTAEVNRAKGAESTITSLLTTTNTSLTSEVSRAKAVEDTLTTKLTEEVARAKAAEAVLTTNLQTLNGEVIALYQFLFICTNMSVPLYL